MAQRYKKRLIRGVKNIGSDIAKSKTGRRVSKSKVAKRTMKSRPVKRYLDSETARKKKIAAFQKTDKFRQMQNKQREQIARAERLEKAIKRRITFGLLGRR